MLVGRVSRSNYASLEIYICEEVRWVGVLKIKTVFFVVRSRDKLFYSLFLFFGGIRGVVFF